MKLPLSWLKEYVRFTQTPEKLAEKMLFSGTKVEEIISKKDETIFDLEITPNRPDTLSILGLAREVAVLTNSELLEPSIKELPSYKKRLPLTFKAQSKKLCPNYSLVIIDQIKVAPSPSWITERLENAGIRAINNIVDITNYAMVELGQPMHAFDYDKISGAKMLLRLSKKGEKITTLDGEERVIPENSIIIEDSEKIIDLAGLMGGQSSEIDEQTSTVVLHVPIYDPTTIRKTSVTLGLRTEASSRFEKLLDLSVHPKALRRAVELILMTAGGEIGSQTITEENQPYLASKIDLSIEETQRFLGAEIGSGEIVEILSSLGFQVRLKPGEDMQILEVTPPSWRRDVTSNVDLYEEIGRIYGYNEFPKTLPKGEVPPQEESTTINLEFKIKEILQGLGFNECYLFTLTSQKMLLSSLINPEETLKLANANSEDFEYLRPHLTPGLLTAAELNLREFENVSLFELGRVFQKELKDSLPIQPKRVTLISSKDFYQLKGVLEVLLKELGITLYSLKEDSYEILETGLSAKILSKNNTLGKIGLLNKKVLQNFGIKKPLTLLDLDFEVLVKLATNERKYEPLPKFPYVQEDFSFTIPGQLPVEEIIKAVAIDPKIEKAEVFDIYTNSALGKKKSIGLGVRYRSKTGTLDKSEIESLRGKIIQALEKLGAQLR